MSRSKSYWYLLGASLAVLPFFVACASSPSRRAAASSNKTDAADTGDGDDSKNYEPDSESKKSDSDKSGDQDGAGKVGEDKSDKRNSDKKADADEADDGKAPTDDSRTTASIANVIKENRKPFKKCYEDVRKDQPELKGNVLLKIVLDGAGKVKKAYVDEESSIRNQKIVDCMIKLAQSLTYPKSSKGLDKDFEYDFGFNNQTK